MTCRGKITLFLLCLSLCLTGFVVHRVSQYKDQDPTELFAAIDSQIKAFRMQNFPSAYQLASSHIQLQWSLEQFTGMVRGDYARIAHAESIEFGPWQRRGHHAIVQVFFVDALGSVAPCIYTLVYENSIWKIDSARWVRGWPDGQRMRGIRS